MEILVDSEINEYSSESDKEHWSAVDAGMSNMNSKPDNPLNLDKNAGDANNLSDISVSSVDTYAPKSMQNSKYIMPIEITNWEPVIIDDKLVIRGSVAGLMQTDRVCKQRLSSLIFKNDDGVTCCILGPMRVLNDVPDMIRNQFKYIYRIEKNGEKIYKDGIPENWLKVCSIWKCYNDTVNKNMFDWPLQFKIFSIQPLIQTNNKNNSDKNIYNGPRTKIKKKFEKYKSMIEQETLRNITIVDSDSDTNVHTIRKSKKKNSNHQEINGFSQINKNTVAIQTNYLDTDPADTSIVNEQTSLNKRTSCYIQNQISNTPDKGTKNSVCCQTDLTQNDFVVDQPHENSIIERNDKNRSSNVTILSPTKPVYKKNTPKSVSENCAINDQLNKKSKNESNKKLSASNTVLKELTNQNALGNNIESTDDTSSLEFYENIVANSTAIDPKTPGKQATCKTINYICSKTLEKIEKRMSLNVDVNPVESLDVIDIDVFSQTIINSPAPRDYTSTICISSETYSESAKKVTSSDPKQLKTIRNNLEKTNINPEISTTATAIKATAKTTTKTTTNTTTNTTTGEDCVYKLRSPKRYIVKKQTKGMKRKKGIELNNRQNAKRIALDPDFTEKNKNTKNTENTKNSENTKYTENTDTSETSETSETVETIETIEITDSPESPNPRRVSRRNRKKLNYREILFSRIILPENTIMPRKTRKSHSPLHIIKNTPNKIKADEKLYKKCFVILRRENLQQKIKKNTDVISTSKFTVTVTNVEKENSTPEPQINAIAKAQTPVENPPEHVFKTPLSTIVKKKKKMFGPNGLPKLNKTIHIPNNMPKITKDQRKLSLPANALEMWNIVKPKAKERPEAPPSPFSLLSDTSSDASDKRRRKLFSPDNWMQSDGCLKNLSQNEYHSSDSRFSIRFDDTDPCMDSEFSDSSMFISS